MTELFEEINQSDDGLVAFNTVIEAQILSACAHACLNSPKCYQLSHKKEEGICLLSICHSTATAGENLMVMINNV